MTENEVLFQISNIVNGGDSFSQAIEQVASLVEREASGKALLVDHFDAPEAVKLLDSFDQPYRSLYSVELRDAGKALGKVTLCFASDRRPGAFARRLANFVGEQLGMLLTRIRLADQRTQLKREIAEIEQDLATRKATQRAAGILVADRGMTPAAATRWIAQQSGKTGLSKLEVAGRIIAYHQAIGLSTESTGLLEQRIA